MTLIWQPQAELALGQPLTRLSTLSGGDFAEAFRGELEDGQSVFIKTHRHPPAFFFSTEATGLQWLRHAGGVNVPKVLAVSDSPPFLVLEWIEPGSAIAETEPELGRLLASLHYRNQSAYGRPDGRTTGSLGVPNEQHTCWADFYANCRLLPLAAIARERNAVSARTIEAIEQLANRLGEHANVEEPASLLHGDLWAGNRLVDVRGQSWLVDPAAHHGHREFDLAMMRLLGGYSEQCFAAYDESYPLQPGWAERVPLHQLAPLLVHAIKFGGGYISAVDQAVSRYT